MQSDVLDYRRLQTSRLLVQQKHECCETAQTLAAVFWNPSATSEPFTTSGVCMNRSLLIYFKIDSRWSWPFQGYVFYVHLPAGFGLKVGVLFVDWGQAIQAKFWRSLGFSPWHLKQSTASGCPSLLVANKADGGVTKGILRNESRGWRKWRVASSVLGSVQGKSVWMLISCSQNCPGKVVASAR